MAKGADIRNLEVYQDAMILERMTYRTEHKIMNKYKKLWKDIIDEASAIYDGISDAYYMPKENFEGKYDAACFAMSHLVRLERKLDIANSPDVQTISNDVRAKYDIQIHKIRINLEGWSNSLREFCWQRMRLRLHPKKFDIQHYSKGIRVGAFKVRFDRILPNDRIAHNWLYKMRRFADLVSRSPEMVWQFKDKVVSVCNSYLGLLKWCNSYRLRTQGVDMLKNSEWSKYIEFDKDNLVAHIFKKYTENAVVIRQTRERKREFELQMAMAA